MSAIETITNCFARVHLTARKRDKQDIMCAKKRSESWSDIIYREQPSQSRTSFQHYLSHFLIPSSLSVWNLTLLSQQKLFTGVTEKTRGASRPQQVMKPKNTNSTLFISLSRRSSLSVWNLSTLGPRLSQQKVITRLAGADRQFPVYFERHELNQKIIQYADKW